MSQKRIDFISIEEFQKIYKAEKDKSLKLFMLLGFGSGLRISEIVGFQRKFRTKKGIRLNESSKIPPLTKEMIDLKGHQIRLEDGKGRKWRTTITPPSLTEPMLELLPITIPRRTIQDKFSKLTQKVLGKKMSVHTLRHGFGNYQANVLKTPLPMVQQMMGHSRLDTTGIYTKANPEQAIAAVWKSMTGEN